MSRIILDLFFVLTLVLGSGPRRGIAHANGNIESSMITYSAGDGHRVPTPFDTANRRFELADGEVYLLYGTVVLLPSLVNDSGTLTPYLNIDFQRASWLKNAKRSQTPYYRLRESSFRWDDWNNNKKNILVKAHGEVIQEKNGIHEYEISLEPIM